MNAISDPLGNGDPTRHGRPFSRALRPSSPAYLRNRLALAVAGLLCLMPVLSACDMNSLLGKKADCSAYQEEPKKGAATPLLLVLLDLSSNSAATAGQVATAMRPYIDRALANGQYVKVISSGGTGTGTKTFPCFTGDKPFLVKRNNSTRQDKDREKGGEALQTEFDHVVQETPVSQTGSITSLLGAANDDIQSLRTTPDVTLGDVTVVIWSDLMGTGEQGDCMNLDNKQATVGVAEGIVERCFATSQISAVKDAKIRFIGTNQGDLTAPQQDLSRYLRGELCRRLSDDCS